VSTLAFFGLNWIGSENPRHAPIEACAIYQAYYDTFETKDEQFFWPIAGGFGLLNDTNSGQSAPATFRRETGEYESVNYSGGNFDRAIFETFEFDASALFANLYVEKTERIRRCFSGDPEKPRFSTLSLSALELREEGNLRPWLTPNSLTTNYVSIISFSEDNSYAFFYAESHCGGLCGGGSYYLFQKINGRWKQIGVSMVWVS